MMEVYQYEVMDFIQEKHPLLLTDNLSKSTVPVHTRIACVEFHEYLPELFSEKQKMPTKKTHL